MSIAFRSGSTGGSATASSVTIGVPSGTVDGDILVLLLYHEGGAWTIPGTWNQIGTRAANYQNNAYITCMWRRASSEPTDYTFSLSASFYNSAIMLAFSGCLASGDVIDATIAYNANTDQTMVCDTITTTVADTRLVALMGNYWGQFSFSDVPAGFTSCTLFADCYTYSAAQASTGATGQKTWTFTNPNAGAGYWVTRHIALKPASTGSLQTISAVTPIDTAEAFGSATFTMTQLLKPASDVAAGAWTTQAGSGTGLYAVIDEVSVSDSDYIQSEIKPSSSVCTIALEAGSDPGVHTGHLVRYRYAKNAASGNAIGLTVRLMQGATEIASWTHTNISESWTTVEQTLTSTQAGNITDYSVLRLQFEATES